jgi:hypothetical protein
MRRIIPAGYIEYCSSSSSSNAPNQDGWGLKRSTVLHGGDQLDRLGKLSNIKIYFCFSHRFDPSLLLLLLLSALLLHRE